VNDGLMRCFVEPIFEERRKARMADALPEEIANPELVEMLRSLPVEAFAPGVRAEAERLRALQASAERRAE
jgi:hypothetical protein